MRDGWLPRIGRHPLLPASLLAMALAACAPVRQAPRAQPEAGLRHAQASLYVIQRGWHTDIGFPTAELPPDLAQLGQDLPGARYLIFGFGDRHYVLARDKNFGGMVAALWPGPGLILATGLTAAPERAFGPDQVTRLAVTRAQSEAAAAFVRRSLSTAAGDRPRPYASGPYGGSLFYASSSTYDGWHTCNTWTAEALQAADLPVRSFGVVLASQVWNQARGLAADDGAAQYAVAGHE